MERYKTASGAVGLSESAAWMGRTLSRRQFSGLDTVKVKIPWCILRLLCGLRFASVGTKPRSTRPRVPRIGGPPHNRSKIYHGILNRVVSDTFLIIFFDFLFFFTDIVDRTFQSFDRDSMLLCVIPQCRMNRLLGEKRAMYFYRRKSV